ERRRRVLTGRIRRLVLGVLGIVGAVVLLLRGCGPYYLNLSPGTDSGGLVSIETNHAQYRLYDSVQVTVTNRLHTPIYTLYFPDYDCSIDLVPERFEGGAWWDDSLGTGSAESTSRGCCGAPPCGESPVRHPNELLQIDPGTSFVQDWHPPGPYVPGPMVLPQAGPHRISFLYTTDRQIISERMITGGLQPTHDQLYPLPDLPVVTSATLQVEDGGYRPPTPQPCV